MVKMVNEKKWITLNVGGTYFMTSRSTLTKGTPANSPLHRMSNNSTNVHWDRDERGAYVIDRDPMYFQPVLNYLRYGRLLINRDLPEEGVLLEAEYFNLPQLANEVRTRIEARARQQRYQSHLMELGAPTFGYQGLPIPNQFANGAQHQANHNHNHNSSNGSGNGNNFSSLAPSLTPTLSQSPFPNLESYVNNILDQKLI